jgi:hypothetical protein
MNESRPLMSAEVLLVLKLRRYGGADRASVRQGLFSKDVEGHVLHCKLSFSTCELMSALGGSIRMARTNGHTSN